MQKMIPLEKMSKKARRQLAAEQRGSWGDISPVTRMVQSRKVYDRKRAAREAARYE